jgi:hypothetical protein
VSLNSKSPDHEQHCHDRLTQAERCEHREHDVMAEERHRDADDLQHGGDEAETGEHARNENDSV